MRDENSKDGVHREKTSGKSFLRSEPFVRVIAAKKPTLDWLMQWDLCIALAAVVPGIDAAAFKAARKKCESLNPVLELEENWTLKAALDIGNPLTKTKALESALNGRPNLRADLVKNEALRSELDKNPDLVAALAEFPTPGSAFEKNSTSTLKAAFEEIKEIACMYLGCLARDGNEVPETKEQTRRKLEKALKILGRAAQHRNRLPVLAHARTKMVALVAGGSQLEHRLIPNYWRHNWAKSVMTQPGVLIPGLKAALAELEDDDPNAGQGLPKPKPGPATQWAERDAFYELAAVFQSLTGKPPSRCAAEHDGTDSKFAEFATAVLRAVNPEVKIDDGLWFVQILAKLEPEAERD